MNLFKHTSFFYYIFRQEVRPRLISVRAISQCLSNCSSRKLNSTRHGKHKRARFIQCEHRAPCWGFQIICKHNEATAVTHNLKKGSKGATKQSVIFWFWCNKLPPMITEHRLHYESTAQITLKWFLLETCFHFCASRETGGIMQPFSQVEQNSA